MTAISTPVTNVSPETAASPALAQPPVILGIVGSPRKGGNTDILVSRILEGARESGATVESVYLNDLVIRECTGCHACWNEKPCSLRDDMNDLYPRIAAADAFVFGTPVYWYGPTALMKAFIDRFVYFNCPQHCSGVAGKPVVLAIPYEEDDSSMADGIMLFFRKSLRYLSMSMAGSIIVPGVTIRGEVAKKADVMREAYEAGRRLGRG